MAVTCVPMGGCVRQRNHSSSPAGGIRPAPVPPNLSSMPKLLLCAFLGCAFLCAKTHAASPEPAPTAEADLEKNWLDVQRPEPTSTRFVMTFALQSAALNYHLERVTKAIEILEDLQDKDPASRTYGNFRWYPHQPKPVDLNAVEFIEQQMILLWNLYRDRLTDPDRERLQRMILLSVRGIRSHKVPVEYTNIFVMKTWNCMAIGEAFKQQDLADESYRMFADWLKEVAKNGVHEFLSPTYYATDLQSLALIRHFASRKQDQDAAEAALRFYWVQTRANWFAPAERLGGAHGRDYDYLTGHGAFSIYGVYWGWESVPSANLVLSNGTVRRPGTFFAPTALTNVPDCYLWKPEDVSAYAGLDVLPRYVVNRYGSRPEEIATQYIAPDISIGVAGTNSGHEDKFFTINFANGPSMVMGNLFMDGRGDPYGQNKAVGKDGHKKALHLTPLVASAQAGPSVLLLASFGSPKYPAPKDDSLSCLATHLDLPAEVTLWQAGKEVVAAPGGGAPLDPAQPAFLRLGKMAVGLRFVDATDDHGKTVPPVFYRDGTEYDACRISWTHAKASPTGEAHVLFLATVADGVDSDAAFAEFSRQFSKVQVSSQLHGDKISAQAKPEGQTPLELEADFTTGDRRGTPPPASGILEVNGKEVGEPILAAALAGLTSADAR